MGLAKKAVGDASITFLWVFAMASLGSVSTAIAQSVGLENPKNKIYIIVFLFSLLNFFFSILGQALGGASWNPTALVAFSYAGVSNDDLFTLAVRLPAQMAGAVGGALAVLEVTPKKYRHMLGGPKLRVPLQTGVIAEAVLTFAITLVVMWVLLRGPRNPVVKTFIIIGATLSLVAAGGAYTGPAMNPANAFGWAFVSNEHKSWEHFAVYWAGPMIGTIFAVWAFNLLFGSQQAYKATAAKNAKANEASKEESRESRPEEEVAKSTEKVGAEDKEKEL